MPPASTARDLFDQIVGAGDPFARISSMIGSNPPTTEGDHFDCKLLPRDAKKRDDKAKELWSEVLGGFANAGGGVVIWGLDARKQPVDGVDIDCVVGAEYIDRPRAFEGRLRELQRQSTEPPLGNVEIRAVPDPADDTRGFVVCFVPEGPDKPYRSESAGKRYYLRLGDNTQPMPHSTLRSMFHPNPSAVFQPVAEWWWEHLLPHSVSGMHSPTRLGCRVQVRNTGTASGKDIYIAVGTGLGSMVQIADFQPEWKVVASGPEEAHLTSTIPLHPQRVTALLTAVATVGGETGPDRMVTPFVRVPDPHVRLTVYCEHQLAQVFECRPDLGEMKEHYRSSGHVERVMA